MGTVSLLIKPVSGLCNLNCRYCFYRPLYEKKNDALMDGDVLETLVREALSAPSCSVQFAFQGGEPTLAGLEYFRRFIAYEKKYARSGQHIEHSIQTNGVLIDDEWAAFFKESDFLVGVSIDGIQGIHDSCRPFADGRGSYQKAVDAFRLLKRKNVKANALCVVTSDVAKHAAEVYEGLKAIGAGYIQLIPCLDDFGERGCNDFSLSPDAYGVFLSELFELWYSDYVSGNYVSIRTFDDLVHLLCGRPAGSCSACGKCGQYLVIESDGSVYPCDFFVGEKYRLGSILEHGIDDLYRRSAGSEFMSKALCRPAECADCMYYAACRGGCARNMVAGENGPRNYYCSAFKCFFERAFSRLMEIASREELAGSISGT